MTSLRNILTESD